MSGIMSIIMSGSRLNNFTRKATFLTNTSWTVPSDCPNIIRVKAWGAGGSHQTAGSPGGPGGYAQADITVTTGETLLVAVGGGAGAGLVGGANGGANGVTSYGGSGGYSGVFRNNAASQANALIIAGGGGASGIINSAAYAGGPGGGVNGVSGLGNNIDNGNGGTQTAGGPFYNAGTAGSALQGGTGVGNGGCAGGGGYWGGGSGVKGGGGSGYVTGINTSNLASARFSTSPPNTGDADWLNPYGISGQNGYVVIYY
jgi:hypothetical protein